MIRVTVTGSECTGKTTLATSLADRYATAWSAEFVREFVSATRATPTSGDVKAIAEGQIELEDAAARTASGLLILDTDLLSNIVYARHYFGSCPRWIEDTFRRRAASLYLLAGTDVPWTPDGVYRDRGDRREEMQSLFRDALEARCLPYAEVRGSHAERMKIATRAIDQLTACGKSPTRPR